MDVDDFIKLGFWSQLVFLGMVDAGTLYAFINTGAEWYHWVGFTTVNVVLLGATWRMWLWLRDETTPDLPPTLSD